jgi:hypothetical protein
MKRRKGGRERSGVFFFHRSTGARRPPGFTRRSLRRCTGPAACSYRSAQSEPLLYHELSQGETEELPRVGQPPQPCPRKKISSDHRSEFSPGRSAGRAAPPRRTRPLRQGRTQNELKEQRAKSKLAEVRREKGKVSGFGYLVFSPPAPGQMDARFPTQELP